jgi:hypothetical protein
MDYRQPIEPQIVILVTIGLFGTRDWTASAEEAEDFRQHQLEPLMAYTFTETPLTD